MFPFQRSLKNKSFEYSRLDKLDMTKLAQFKPKKAMGLAAANEEGTVGALMGMGFVWHNKWGLMDQPSGQPFGGQPQHSQQTSPPPVPL
jgi:membrane protease subunit (stomatin/prohibitin family)